MADARWEDVRGKELRYQDRTWELTGEVDLRGTGERILVRARRVDGVKHEHATLLFSIAEGEDSLNPGDLDDVFVRLEQDGDREILVVRKDPRSYRYELHSLEYE